MTLKNYTEVGNKKYGYTITKVNDTVSHIICKEAKLDQEFLNEDLVELLSDLPNLIKSEQKFQEKQESVIRFRVSASEKIKIQKLVKQKGYKTTTEFIKDKILN